MFNSSCVSQGTDFKPTLLVKFRYPFFSLIVDDEDTSNHSLLSNEYVVLRICFVYFLFVVRDFVDTRISIFCSLSVNSN